jgi:hypothetical protein
MHYLSHRKSITDEISCTETVLEEECTVTSTLLPTITDLHCFHPCQYFQFSESSKIKLCVLHSVILWVMTPCSLVHEAASLLILSRSGSHTIPVSRSMTQWPRFAFCCGWQQQMYWCCLVTPTPMEMFQSSKRSHATLEGSSVAECDLCHWVCSSWCFKRALLDYEDEGTMLLQNVRKLNTQWHSITSWMTCTFSNTAVRPSNLTSHTCR